MILITGGTGYIGPQLVHSLRKDPKFCNHKVILFDSLRGRFDYFDNPTKSYKVFKRLNQENSDIELVTGDVRYKDNTLNDLVKEADYVFHMAAVTGASYSNDNRKLYWETIFDGTMNIFEAAKKTELEKFVNISSCNVYGRSPGETLDEESEINPANTYAKAKASAEQVIKDRASAEGVPAVSLRLATNFGKQTPEFGGTRYNLVVNKFVKLAMENRPLTPYGNGKNWRPFIHVRDSARLIKEVAKGDIGRGKVFNAGFTEMNHKIEEISSKVKEKVESETGEEVEIDYRREEDPGPSYRVDFSKIENKLNLQPKFDLDKGVLGLIKHYEKGGESIIEDWNV